MPHRLPNSGRILSLDSCDCRARMDSFRLSFDERSLLRFSVGIYLQFRNAQLSCHLCSSLHGKHGIHSINSYGFFYDPNQRHQHYGGREQNHYDNYDINSVCHANRWHTDGDALFDQ